MLRRGPVGWPCVETGPVGWPCGVLRRGPVGWPCVETVACRLAVC